MFKWLKGLGKKKEEVTEKDEEIEINDEELEQQMEEIEQIEEIEEKEEATEDSKEIIEEEDIEQLAEELEDVSEELEDVVEEAVEAVEEIKEELQDIEEDIQEEIVDELPEPEEIEVEEEVEETSPKKTGFFQKLMGGLTKTRNDITNKIDSVLKSYKKIDEELFDDLEEVLVTADVGVNTTMELIDRLRNRVKEEKVTDPDNVKELLKDEIKKIMLESVSDNKLNIEPSPALILVVGVNGVGKTTTIGKLSNNFKKQGKKVLIAAGDTFRAAAIEQLEEWGNRANVDVISHSEGADPAAVIYDGIQAAKARKTDILICDTAGRLHNKSNLMNELNKIFRVAEREYGDATKEVLLVLDATTGQNAINQAKVFKEVANITGVALTKLDGTAKGGVIIALQAELNIPVKLVGVGEGIEDLQPFIVEDFVEAIFD
ncbi:signal recognition particle-docking protein FtsY [Tissierella pigra]|uniref:Signal recognition particle receptor FtsY n=1 Tax=Tissierella pigra TaxID=2607614 RepID=A0A6N7XUP9_9FIRM|nr:signal recognition particle-docking protein FtsY [Tissierella pigra]MBU5426506.1 signal recognition particle-docking protein FtsY [Tissierella pigra]MSU00048.1 signal recognition particle-docking protein FtsY [Tissierella pigra]